MSEIQVIQEGRWRFRDQVFGRALKDIVFTETPALADGKIPARSVDDFCAERDDEGRGRLRVLPFIELDDYLRDGDLMVMKTLAPVSGLIASRKADMLKQRGWHAEIVARENNGSCHNYAPWHDRIIPWRCTDMANHPHAADALIDIYRVNTGVDEIRESKLKAEVRRWREIFGQHRFPNKADHFDIHEYLDPADFSTVDDLKDIARRLIRMDYDQVAKVTCVQWAYQVLCLALNVPLTKAVLENMGVYEDYCRNWDALGLAEDVTPLGQLPFCPYTPAETIQSFLNTYADGVDLIPLLRVGNFVGDLLDKDIGTLISHAAAADVLSDYFARVRASNNLAEPLVVSGRPPYHHVMPIHPFCEVRRPSRSDNLSWSYIGTAVRDSQVEEQ